ncbi:MAG: malectin domain-containing carbohydrate-binding protein [Ferruginibacter sp.]
MAFFLISSFNLLAQNVRSDINLNQNWKTIADDSDENKFNGFEKINFNDKNWKSVAVPHNWDDYGGYRRMLHGNRHGYAWYKKTFAVKKQNGKRYFLWFEGVGSYATVWLNGKKVGAHAGGRTSFTIDITDYLLPNNDLSVMADHPAFIKGLPWVCGACSDERGFSEGSQPMGIFRPVHLIVTNDIRVEPFGVHAWNDSTVSEKAATISLATTIKNYTNAEKNIEILSSLIDAKGNKLVSIITNKKISGLSSIEIPQQLTLSNNVKLWSLENPYLYNIVSLIKENGRTVDSLVTAYGIRWISWPINKAPSSNQFLLNGKPVFINGIAEYEHLLGGSHAFSDEEIFSRARMIKATGFNAFRDAHQPHNLRYMHCWDSLGILCWTQLSAHIWYDTKSFRDNFKSALKEWVIERRNSPSVVLWGLQNESKLPADFAKECTELIRSLDPTASSQRLVTTCNGGEGSDWDVPQNWSGTYGGDPTTYATDIKKQKLIGEYGALRTIDLHSEGGFKQNGILSEDRMTQLMEMKIRLAESSKDSSCGQFFWLFNSHDNPGRVQAGEGFREMDRIGPVNYKGIFTSWEEPTDAFYMFRSNYADKEKDPMIYIVSHTWPDRWTTTGKKDSIIVYSNCDEVELFNDVNNISLGKRKRNGIGTHFQWDDVNIKYNVLYAVGYVNGKAVVKDTVILHHLPISPDYNKLYIASKETTTKDFYNIYRVNCGGPDYIDQDKNIWHADKKFEAPDPKSKIQNYNWGSSSWTDDFKGMPAFFASQRNTNAAIAGTQDWPLFQTFRYGREKLKYQFAVPNGSYLVELSFTEPWLGIGSKMDCSGMRVFDVAINDSVIIKDLDIWKEAGSNRALKKTVLVKVDHSQIIIHFPNVKAGEAIISAISIRGEKYPLGINFIRNTGLLQIIHSDSISYEISIQKWLSTGQQAYTDRIAKFSKLPSELFGAEWILRPQLAETNLFAFSVTADAFVYLAIDSVLSHSHMLDGYENTKAMLQTTDSVSHSYLLYRKKFMKEEKMLMPNQNVEPNEYSNSFFVFALPVSNMQPAYDLKTLTTYKAINAKLSEGVEKKTVNEKDVVVFNRNQSKVEWNIQTGAADIYSLTFRYANTTGKDLSAKLELLMADGTVMKTEQLHFTQSKTGKWNYATTNTGSMINAGNYVIRLIAEDAVGLVVTGVDVQ